MYSEIARGNILLILFKNIFRTFIFIVLGTVHIKIWKCGLCSRIGINIFNWVGLEASCKKGVGVKKYKYV